MTRGRFYAVAMPIAALVYVIALLITHNSTVTVVGAMLFAVIAVAGTAIGRGRR